MRGKQKGRKQEADRDKARGREKAEKEKYGERANRGKIKVCCLIFVLQGGVEELTRKKSNLPDHMNQMKANLDRNLAIPHMLTMKVSLYNIFVADFGSILIHWKLFFVGFLKF